MWLFIRILDLNNFNVVVDSPGWKTSEERSRSDDCEFSHFWFKRNCKIFTTVFQMELGRKKMSFMDITVYTQIMTHRVVHIQTEQSYWTRHGRRVRVSQIRDGGRYWWRWNVISSKSPWRRDRFNYPFKTRQSSSAVCKNKQQQSTAHPRRFLSFFRLRRRLVHVNNASFSPRYKSRNDRHFLAAVRPSRFRVVGTRAYFHFISTLTGGGRNNLFIRIRKFIFVFFLFFRGCCFFCNEIRSHCSRAEDSRSVSYRVLLSVSGVLFLHV